MAAKAGWEGRYLEDFEAGDVFRSRVGRTISEADNTWFTLLTNNDNQIHFNDEYAKRTQWGQRLVNSTFTLALVTGLTVTDVSQNGVALGWDTVRLPNPLFAGDTVWAETEVLSVRESRSDSTRGIVKVRTRGVKQDGTVVIEFERSVMVWKRAHAPAGSAFPEVADPAD